EVPPLRQRREDILPLARSFLKATAARLHVPEPVLDAAAEAALLSYDFPGNARELQNLVERAVVLAPTTAGQLRFDLAHAEARAASVPAASAPAEPLDPAEVVPMAAIRDLERRNIVNALDRCHFKVSGDHGAARMLGMSASTLAYRMKQLGIRRTK
ncbi:MAG TPA: helix-turn-helix domain-containing protein, partial [Solirubrobacteraceae bacterium]|nr:helix-turn-helix domain-containing protein [Solirubrobacteraceae bacterium]